jgi:hypothetical protein
MKAQAQGFVWDQKGAVTIDQFGDFIATLIGSTIKFKHFDRLTYLKERDKYYVGLLITARDHKKTCELLTSGEAFEVVVNEADANARPMDFNFFVVNKKTWCGLYLWYRGSCSLRLFGDFCKTQYNDCLTHHRDNALTELAELGDKKLTRKDETLVRRKYKAGQFKVRPLMMRESVNRQLQRLREIRRIAWTYATPRVAEGMFTSVKDNVSLEKGQLSFNVSQTHVRPVRNAIVDFFQSDVPSAGTVYGKTADGVDDKVSLELEPEIFGTWDYDEITNNKALDVSRVQDSPVFDLLLDTAAENKKLFEG